jgi:hypothetical protein
MYPSTSEHVPTCAYMRHRQNEPFAPKQQRSSACLWYIVGGELSEQQINIEFCVKTGKSASDTSTLFTVAYEEIECS